MENNSHFDSFELQFTPIAQSFYREAGKWARFLSILGFIFIAIYVIWGFVLMAGSAAAGSDPALSGMGGVGAMAALGGTVLGVIVIIAAVVMFFPTLYLYRFGSKAKLALDNNNTEYLTNSIENLKSYFKFFGILMIIYLVFMVIGIIIAVVGGIAAASATGSM